MIPVEPGEVIDRLTILMLKMKHAGSESAQKIFPELLRYLNEYSNHYKNQKLLDKLYNVNAHIWNLESAIRSGDKLPLAEVGKRALEIRDWNKKRVALKNSVNKYKEIKINHRSQ